MNSVIIGNHSGVWGIEHVEATPEARQQAHAENYWGTLLVVSEDEAQRVVGQPVADEYDDSGELVAEAVWPKNYQKA